MVGANSRVGLLFDPIRAHLIDRGDSGPEDSTGIRLSAGSPSLTLNPGRIAPTHPAFAGDSHRHWVPSRKVLVAEFTVAGRALFVIVCHLKSMRSLSRREEDYTKKQRHAQAEIIHQFATDLLACDPGAAIALLGDFNDVPGSKTLKLLKGERLHNLLDDQPRGQCYTRRHGNQPQALDHILSKQTSIGARRIELQSLTDVAADLNIQYRQDISKLQDLDYTEAISDLTNQKMVLEAAQLSFKQVSQMSLFNYL